MTKAYRVLNTAELIGRATKESPTVSDFVQVAPREPVKPQTDEEIIARLRERFEILDDMTRAVKKGAVRALIVSGPPGVGKSFGVERVLSKHDLLADVANDSKLKKYEIVKGAASAIGLYKKLYEFFRATQCIGT